MHPCRIGNKISFFAKNHFPVSVKDCVTTSLVLLTATLLCYLLRPVAQGDSHVPLVFVLAVLVVSMSTEGYLYGLIATVLSVIGVNYAFTFPYYTINFTMTGYPVTFMCMSAVSVITCTLASRARSSEAIRLKNDRERMRSDLLRTISHDLRTPLTTISGSAGLILDNRGRFSEEDVYSLLAEIREEAEWLNTVLDNILNVTRFSDNAEEYLQTKPEIVEEIIEEAVHRFRKQSLSSRVQVEVQLPQEVMIVSMNAMMIEQALINLMINAVRHGRTASRILVTAEDKNTSILFHVKDNGAGFDERLLPHLFEGDEAFAGFREGDDSDRFMGIGLSVCRSIVEAHGGTIHAGNLPDGGAEVTFSLPCGSAARI